jgi:hypothetical protein
MSRRRVPASCNGLPHRAAWLLPLLLAATAPAQLFNSEFGSGISTTGDNTGAAVAILGDINGDGLDDLVIGAPFDDDTGTNTGTVYVISGLDGAILREHHGNAANDEYGTAVINAGNLDGDAFDDYVIGAPGVDATGVDRGGISAFSGASGSSIYSQLGPKAGSRFGTVLAGGGDITGDGRDDFLVGAPSWDSVTAFENQGWFGAYSGLTGALVKQANGTAFTHALGSALAVLEDLNGDGRADYAVGLPGYDNGPGGEFLSNAGRVDVYSGLTHTLLYSLWGGANDGLGSSLAPAGDTDADGVPELIVGAPFDLSGSGTASVHEGATGTLLQQLQGLGTTAADAFGTAVAPVGDIDGDGHDDIAVGAPLSAPLAGNGGYVRLISGATWGPAGAWGGVVTCPNAGDGMGRSLSQSTGDVNGDDWNDLLVGWAFNDFAGADCGVARTFVSTYYQPNLNFGGPGASWLGMYGMQLLPGKVADLGLFWTNKPNSTVWLVASPVELLAPFKGGTLVPSASAGLLLPFVTNAQGHLKITDIPGGGGPLIVFMQFMIPDASQPKGWQLSNAIAAEFLP